MSDEPSYLDYVREAFNASPRIPGLGNIPLNWLGLASVATLGLLHPGFLLVGAGLELAYLAALSNNPRFQNYVRGARLASRDAAEQSAAEDYTASRLASLSEDERTRYNRLTKRISAVPRSGEGAQGLIANVAHQGLEVLRATYLDALLAASRLAASADPARRRKVQDEIDTEIRALEALGTDGDPRVRRSREGTLEILRRRLANLDEAIRDHAYLHSELRRVEKQVALVIEEASLADDPADLTARIDHVNTTFGETREWMRLHRELLDEPEGGSTPPRSPLAQREL